MNTCKHQASQMLASTTQPVATVRRAGGGGEEGGEGGWGDMSGSCMLGGGKGCHALVGAILSTPPAVATSPQIRLHTQPDAQVWPARAVERCCLLHENI
jgi:hypothetical protein